MKYLILLLASFTASASTLKTTDAALWVFDASAQTVDVSLVPNLIHVTKIYNITDGVLLYDPNNPDAGGSELNDIVTLNYNTTAMSDADRLQILYEVITPNYYMEVAKRTISGTRILHKFGHNGNVGGTYEPITGPGLYNTPQVADATTIRIKAGGNANDSAAGSGARSVTIEGLDETGAFVSETLVTAGSSASSATSTTFMRVFHTYVATSGTYATMTAGSHAATITLENGAGTQDWAIISLDNYAEGASSIGFYTVPLGSTAYIKSINVSVDSNKNATILGISRPNILQTAAPYSAKTVFTEFSFTSGGETIIPTVPYGPFPPLTDIGFIARFATGSGTLDIDFEIIVIED